MTSLAVPGCAAPCTATDVVVDSTINCTTVKERNLKQKAVPSGSYDMNHIIDNMKIIYNALYIPPKPVSEDSGIGATLTWNVPMGNCGITQEDVPASGTEGQPGYTPAELHHVIYVNPPASSAHVMHQVKLTCKHETLIERIV